MHEEKDLSALSKREILPFSLMSVFVGALASLAVCLYVFMYSHVFHLSVKLYAMSTSVFSLALLQIFVILVIALLSFLIITRIPFLIGSGIPQAVGITHGKFTKYKIIYIPYVFFLTLGSVFCGLPYGFEGPSVFLGSMIGDKSSKLLGRNKMDTSFFAEAGFASAFCTCFNSPLSALSFTLEEGDEKLSAKFLVSVGLAVVTATLIRRLIIGSSAIFSHFVIPTEIGAVAYVGLFALALATGIIAPLFNKLLISVRKFHKKINKKWLLPLYLTPFLFAFGLGKLSGDFLWSGELILGRIAYPMSMPIVAVLGILIARFFLIALNMTARTSGGLFFPSLIQGAMIGYIVAQIAMFIGMDSNLTTLFVLVGMMGFLAAMTKAPLTACLLIFELTGGTAGIVPAIFVVVISFIVSEFISKKCFYTYILEDLITTAVEVEDKTTFVMDDESELF